MKLLKVIIFVMLILLSSCKPKSPQTPTQGPDAIYTSAAQTVAVRLTANAKSNPSSTPSPTVTITQTLVVSPSATVTLASATTSLPPSVTIPVTRDRVEYINQSPQDGRV